MSGMERLRDTNAEQRAAAAKIKIGALMTALSLDTIDIIENLQMSDNDRRDADRVVQALDEFIEGGTNHRVYRKQLHERTRHEGETIEAFMVALRKICRRCKYVPRPATTIEDEILLDTLITNVNDQEISKELIRLSRDKTLQDAIVNEFPGSAPRVDGGKKKPSKNTPTILRILGLDPNSLSAVRKEGTPVLPGLDFDR